MLTLNVFASRQPRYLYKRIGFRSYIYIVSNSTHTCTVNKLNKFFFSPESTKTDFLDLVLLAIVKRHSDKFVIPVYALYL